ncbi:hypothetical protein RW1_005_00890 [Rhodococcus wratislaviensis NBRC 100605]|uniref:Condensation domain-containing protein n=1 Tax=Rhodococcus wratislaviensis NBRC 100605 TaxID=1219028 RepID=X0PKR9_RHOWR|nr:condensation domain-containing protein [Rhodococcus wratislaviensis]GAF42984.1 hypothetical protein RW1_005_00890 [Rhodococcus wratislaviensis NBRC 100605]
MPLTPIAHWLLARATDIGRFSQAALFTAPTGLDRDSLAGTVQTVLDHHDLLRARLRRTGSPRDAAVEVLPVGSVTAAELLHRVPVDETEGARFQSIADTALRSATARLDPDSGVMVQVVWFESTADRPDRGRLLFVIHHLAVDGVSWRILVPDLAAAWAAVSTGTPPTLPPVGTSMRRWAHALTDTAPDRANELPLWLGILDGPDPRLGSRPLDPTLDTDATARDITIGLPAETTRALLTTVPDAFHGAVDDALLTALALAVSTFRRRRGHPADNTLIGLEGHGRDNTLIPGADLSRTVGWFTTIHPVRLDLTGIDLGDALTGGPAAGTALKTVKEQLRTIPDHGAGYGQLRYLDPHTADRLRDLPQPQIIFNYLGRFTTGETVEATADMNSGEANSGWIPLDSEQLAPNAGSPLPSASVVSINAAAVGPAGDQQLKSTWTFAAGVLTAGEVTELAELWTQALTALTTHTHTPHAGGLTPPTSTSSPSTNTPSTPSKPTTPPSPTSGPSPHSKPDSSTTPNSPTPSTPTPSNSSSPSTAPSTPTDSTPPQTHSYTATPTSAPPSPTPPTAPPPKSSPTTPNCPSPTTTSPPKTPTTAPPPPTNSSPPTAPPASTSPTPH